MASSGRSAHELLTDELHAVAETLHADVVERGGGLQFQWPGFPVVLRVDQVSPGNYFAAIYCRTTSWEYPGDRTDLHDALSHLLGAHMTAIGRRSCTLVDVPHPVLDKSTEIYARYVVPEQPTAILRAASGGAHELGELLFVLGHASHLAYHLLMESAGDDRQRWEMKSARAFASVAGEALRLDVDADGILFSDRIGPDLRYFRTPNGRLSVISSEEVASLFDGFRVLIKDQTTRGAGGTLHVAGDVFHFESDRARRRASAVLSALGDKWLGNILLENRLVAVGSQSVVFMAADSGRMAFLRAREQLRQRHFTERALLFAPASFEWASVVDAERFELLAKDLLARDPNVVWVRSAGPTREGDAGRDLICERIRTARSGEAVGEDVGPAHVERVLVQCKAYSRTVGKSDVQDIRDMLAFHQCTAYLLIVATKLSGTLVRVLEHLRSTPGLDADWWTRAELEDQLARHPDVLMRYADLVAEATGPTV